MSAASPNRPRRSGPVGSVEITARLRTQCRCGEWTSAGDRITWDSESRRTIGCPPCHQTGEHPDRSAYADSDAWLGVAI